MEHGDEAYGALNTQSAGFVFMATVAREQSGEHGLATVATRQKGTHSEGGLRHRQEGRFQGH